MALGAPGGGEWWAGYSPGPEQGVAIVGDVAGIGNLTDIYGPGPADDPYWANPTSTTSG